MRKALAGSDALLNTAPRALKNLSASYTEIEHTHIRTSGHSTLGI